MEAITEYWVEFPVLYNKFLLVLYFSSVYVNPSLPIYPSPLPPKD